MKCIALICALLLSTPVFSIFDLSPWIVVDNKTKLDFVCKIEAICYPSDDEDDHIILLLDNNNGNDLSITFDQGQDADENEFIKITINFICSSEKTFVCNPTFAEDGILFNPQITNVDFIHESLQIVNFCSPTNSQQRYFSIELQQEHGIVTKSHEISIYIKCFNNFKQMIRNLLAAAVNAANSLPY